MKYVLLLFFTFLLGVIAYLSKPSDTRCYDAVANMFEQNFMARNKIETKNVIMVRDYIDSATLNFSQRLSVKDFGLFKVIYYKDDSTNSRVGFAAFKKVIVAE